MQIRQTDSSQKAKAGGFLQFVQRRFLLVLVAISIGAVLAFFTFQLWIGDTPVVPGKVFSLPSENTIIKNFQIISTDPLAYYAILADLDSNEEFVVFNGKVGEKYEKIGPLRYSSNGKHIAYSATRGGQQFVVRDSQESRKYDIITNLDFSPDGKHLAYSVAEDCEIEDDEIEEDNCQTHIVVFDGQEGKRYIDIPLFLFSPNSQQLAYIASDETGSFVVLNEKEDKTYTTVQDILFTLKGNLISVIQESSSGKLFVVLDNQEGKRYDDIECCDFSDDGQHMAYAAQEQDESFVVINGEEQERQRGSIIEFVFSPDRQHLAYTL
ncbi:hypothetical protein IIA94_02185, partial [Patescibacteria group bacterium]|nr:hypothetical protein [Patescibacteria group bacterium]